MSHRPEHESRSEERGVRTIDLGAAAEEEIYPGIRRWMASGRRMTVTRYRFSAGATFPMHHHDQEQITVVLEGSVVFHTTTLRVAVGAWQMIVIDPNEPHAATAGPHGATVLSVVSPARRHARDYVVGERA
jgi:quercetin dioxygenase-like cupin family protein